MAFSCIYDVCALQKRAVQSRNKDRWQNGRKKDIFFCGLHRKNAQRVWSRWWYALSLWSLRKKGKFIYEVRPLVPYGRTVMLFWGINRQLLLLWLAWHHHHRRNASFFCSFSGERKINSALIQTSFCLHCLAGTVTMPLVKLTLIGNTIAYELHDSCTPILGTCTNQPHSGCKAITFFSYSHCRCILLRQKWVSEEVDPGQSRLERSVRREKFGVHVQVLEWMKFRTETHKMRTKLEKLIWSFVRWISTERGIHSWKIIIRALNRSKRGKLWKLFWGEKCGQWLLATAPRSVPQYKG